MWFEVFDTEIHPELHACKPEVLTLITYQHDGKTGSGVFFIITQCLYKLQCYAVCKAAQFSLYVCMYVCMYV